MDPISSRSSRNSSSNNNSNNTSGNDIKQDEDDHYEYNNNSSSNNHDGAGTAAAPFAEDGEDLDMLLEGCREGLPSYFLGDTTGNENDDNNNNNNNNNEYATEETLNANPAFVVSQTQQQHQSQQQIQKEEAVPSPVRPPSPPPSSQVPLEPNPTTTTTTSTTAADNSNYTMPGVTRSNGLGEWSAWKRGFNKPRDACLDLLDNCFDATLHEGFHGRVVMRRFLPNGICIINNSFKRIKEMEEILVPYNSSKGAQGNAQVQDAIGENGIGLKHGCANLSDTSFALCRNDNEFSLGIIAHALQTTDGICLPSYTFTIEDDECKMPQQIEDELRHHVERIAQLPQIGPLIQTQFGRFHSTREEGTMVSAVDRLVKQFQTLWGDEWGEEEHVFMLIVADLSHTHNTDGPNSNVQANSKRDHNSMHPATIFLQEIKAVLPENYINIPSNNFEFFIEQSNGSFEKVQFSYWQRRLVELSKFVVHVHPEQSAEEMHDMDWDKRGYPLSIYCGFDPLRLQAKTRTALNLRIYSRSSGRLIRDHPDGRGLLGLSNQGSDYGQGLTVIVDDVHGKLPLQPNKQDIAWSEQTHGGTHEANFLAWISAVARAYYEYHKFRLGDNKTNLTAAVKEWVSPVQKYIHDQEERVRSQRVLQRGEIKRLEIADLNTFAPEWKKSRAGLSKFKILVHDKYSLGKKPYFHKGKDTLFQFSRAQLADATSPPASKPKELRSGTKNSGSTTNNNNGQSPMTRKRARLDPDGTASAVINIDDDGEDDGEMVINGSGQANQLQQHTNGFPYQQRVARKTASNGSKNGEITAISSVVANQLQQQINTLRAQLQHERMSVAKHSQAAMHYHQQREQARSALAQTQREVSLLQQQLQREQERNRHTGDVNSLVEENERLKQQLEERDEMIRKLRTDAAGQGTTAVKKETEDFGIGSPQFLSYLREQSANNGADTFTV